MMCCWMVWGCVRYFLAECDAEGEGAAGGGSTPAGGDAEWAPLRWARCSPWVAWVCANALFHLFWVSVLTVCQLYLAVCLGMTTNEQLNRGRYRHFQAAGGRSPFSRGPLRNAIDFFQCGLCGLVAPPARRDWSASPPPSPTAAAAPDAALDADPTFDDRQPMLADHESV